MPNRKPRERRSTPAKRRRSQPKSQRPTRAAVGEQPSNPLREAYERFAIRGEALPVQARAELDQQRAAREQTPEDAQRARVLDRTGYVLFELVCAAVYRRSIESQADIDRALAAMGYRDEHARRADVVHACLVRDNTREALKLLRRADGAFASQADDQLLPALAKAYGPKNNRRDFGAAASMSLAFGAFGDKLELKGVEGKTETQEEAIVRLSDAYREGWSRTQDLVVRAGPIPRLPTKKVTPP